MRSFIKKVLIPCFTFAFSALVLQACSADPNDGGGKSCVPNSTQACTCTGTDTGVQTCQASGVYTPCTCNGMSSSSGMASSSGMSSGSSSGGMPNCFPGSSQPNVCGNGTMDPGEECDDGNCIPTDACNNCKTAYCGDGVVGPGEMCDDGAGEVCPPDCGMMAMPDAGPDVPVDPCMGKLIFAGFASAQTGAFSYNGQIGLDAATAACQALGGFGMCDYEQWKQIQSSPMMHAADVVKLAMSIPNGQCNDVWLQRTTTATGTEAAACPGGMSAPGPGGNCNNWNYQTGHVADGEHVNICNMGGMITFDYDIDCDTIFDPNNPGPHQDQTMPCNVMKQIPCCYEKCVP